MLDEAASAAAEASQPVQQLSKEEMAALRRKNDPNFKPKPEAKKPAAKAAKKDSDGFAVPPPKGRTNSISKSSAKTQGVTVSRGPRLQKPNCSAQLTLWTTRTGLIKTVLHCSHLARHSSTSTCTVVGGYWVQLEDKPLAQTLYLKSNSAVCVYVHCRQTWARRRRR